TSTPSGTNDCAPARTEVALAGAPDPAVCAPAWQVLTDPGRVRAGAVGGDDAMAAREFDDLVVEARAALDAITQGNPDGYKALLSEGDDITLANPFGGIGRGREAVYEQLERAASYFRDGETVGFETVVQSVGTDLAYTVEIERFRVKVAGQDRLSD